MKQAHLYLKFHMLSLVLGFHIEPNVFGPGLSISHAGTIIVNGRARVGENCRIHVCTVIGTKAGTSGKAPKIGNNIYIGPGAKIFGDIVIADGISIGANSVVNKSFTEPSIGIAGAPAKKINDRGSKGLVPIKLLIELKKDYPDLFENPEEQSGITELPPCNLTPYSPE